VEKAQHANALTALLGKSTEPVATYTRTGCCDVTDAWARQKGGNADLLEAYAQVVCVYKR
jgi:hypothetical protein